jgi:hypothetical protein
LTGLADLGLAYDLAMRRLFLCFLLCLMPLRLWAGVWMPMAQSGSHHAPTLAHVGLAQHDEAPAAHHCHEAMAQSAHQPQLQTLSSLGSVVQKADCQDGTCQLCGVCHQSASPVTWPVFVPVFQAHPLPVGASLAHVARSSPPLTKPPIS